MDVLAAILTCSLYTDDALVRAIVDNAHDNPFAILTPEVEGGGEGQTQPRDSEAAVATLDELTRRGDRPLLGLMQVPVGWAAFFGREPEELFDPCVNLSIGSAMLSEFRYSCDRAAAVHRGSHPDRPTEQRVCTVEKYARAIRVPELVAVVALDLRYQGRPPPPPTEAPLLTPRPERRSWGADRILVAHDPAATMGRSPQEGD